MLDLVDERSMREVKAIPEGLEVDGEKITFHAPEQDKETIKRIVSDLLTRLGFVNIDVEDVAEILEGAERIVLGEGIASGENRCALAAREAVKHFTHAKKALVEVITGVEITLVEIVDTADEVAVSCEDDADLIWGHVIDEDMGESVKVSIIAVV